MAGQPPAELIADVHATAAGTFYAAGAWTGAIWTSDDRAHWTVEYGGLQDKLTLSSIWGEGTPLAVGATHTQLSPYLVEFAPALVTRLNGTWSDQSSTIAKIGDGILRDIWRSPGGKTYIAHWGGVLTEVGGAWKEVVQAPSDSEIRSLWGWGEDHVLALAASKTPLQQSQRVLELIGSTWLSRDIGIWPDLEALHGSGPDNVFAVGGAHACGAPSMGTILRYDGNTWVLVADVPENLLAVWTGGPKDAWFVGHDPCGKGGFTGIVLGWDGQKLERTSLPRPAWGIWGMSAKTLVIAADKMIYWRDCP